jgi:MFS transporter, DHA3 family, tetracycline resistance protein
VDPSFRDHRLVSTQFDIEQPVADAGGWRVLAPFKVREYRLLIAAVSMSIFAEGMWAVVMALQVIELDNDPASLSLVATCLGVGLVAFLLVGGIAADRINQRAIIIVAQTVNVIAVSAVAVLGLVGALHIWHMAVAAATLGVAAAFFFPAYSAILPRLLPAEQLLAANGVEGVVRPVFQRAVGPAVAGMLVGATFPPVGAVAVAALLVVSLLLLVANGPMVKMPAPEPDQEQPHMLSDLRDGFVFMLRTPWLLWTLLFASMFVLVVLGPIEVLLPFIAKDRFADGARM